MTTPVKHLDHLNLSVRSFEESAAFYGRVFGFVVVERGVQAGKPWGVLRAGEALLCLYEHEERTHLGGAALEERRLHGLNHFGLRIQDRAAWERTVAEQGLELLYGGPLSWPHSTAWYVRDPTGHEIEVALWNDDRVAFG